MKNAGAATLFAAGIQTGGFGARLFGYFLFFIPASLLYIFVIFIPSKGFGGILDFSKNPPENIITITLAIIAISAPVILPFVLWERSIRKFRRKNGLSIYKNVREELEQIEFNKEYAKEAKAREAFETSKSSDKMNINYWFELLQKGAITQDEYEAKKRELL
ncbi:SHOCT domain-containing protein [Sulfurimonas crateris]|nr:SHOCT domain-containing protein [Sulfurimonas crateris]